MPYGLERRLAGRWIAGPTMEDALYRAAEINKKGISVVINYLGEDFSRRAEVQGAVDVYLDLIARMAHRRVHGDIAIKPTQIGLCISYSLMKENYMKIIRKARMGGIFVWLDMEEPNRVSPTIKVYLESGPKAGRGICIQAYLKRSFDDAKAITRKGGTVRLVKGAYGYKEGPGIIGSRDGIRSNYREIMEYLFYSSPRFTIATHDMEILRDALALNNRHKRDVTYAMLNGINNPAAKEMAADGEKVALYLPFGTRWVGYSYRRLREIGHIRLLMASLFRSQKL